MRNSQHRLGVRHLAKGPVICLGLRGISCLGEKQEIGGCSRLPPASMPIVFSLDTEEKEGDPIIIVRRVLTSAKKWPLSPPISHALLFLHRVMHLTLRGPFFGQAVSALGFASSWGDYPPSDDEACRHSPVERGGTRALDAPGQKMQVRQSPDLGDSPRWSSICTTIPDRPWGVKCITRFLCYSPSSWARPEAGRGRKLCRESYGDVHAESLYVVDPLLDFRVR
jgi:hypothetical protein